MTGSKCRLVSGEQPDNGCPARGLCEIARRHPRKPGRAPPPYLKILSSLVTGSKN